MIGICHYCNQDKANVSYMDILLKNREKTVLLCSECRELNLSWWDYFKSDNILEKQWNLNRVETVVRNCNKVKEFTRVAAKIVGYDDTNKNKWIYGSSNLFMSITNIWYPSTSSMSVFSASLPLSLQLEWVCDLSFGRNLISSSPR